MKSPSHYPQEPTTPSAIILADDLALTGELDVPRQALGVVLFAHGSGSSRHSPRNQFVARIIREAGFGTMLFDLLTEEEEQEDIVTSALRCSPPASSQSRVGRNNNPPCAI
jgi:predicted alpha/beta-hydrolase family hydrolase